LGIWLDRCPFPSANLLSRLFLLPTRRLHHARQRRIRRRLRVLQRLPVVRVQSLVLELRLSRRAPPCPQSTLDPPSADSSVAAGKSGAAGQHRDAEHLWPLPPPAVALGADCAETWGYPLSVSQTAAGRARRSRASCRGPTQV